MTQSVDQLLVEKIRQGQSDAWSQLIDRYEGRLLAYTLQRVADRSAAEDIVQETFVGFLTSLPHFDARQDLERYLFSIAHHKLADHLRRKGRRPELPLDGTSSRPAGREPPGPGRRPSSIVRSREMQEHEEQALAEALHRLVREWVEKGQLERLQCMELLLVRGWPNKKVAKHLRISQQAVANHKFAALARLREHLRRTGVSSELFPELYEE